MGGSSRQCQVCNEAQSKYKCPSCLIPYCPVTRITKAERPVDVDGPTSFSEICNALKDEHLQKLICDIDKSPDPIEKLDKAMEADVFRIFTDKILSSINP